MPALLQTWKHLLDVPGRCDGPGTGTPALYQVCQGHQEQEERHREHSVAGQFSRGANTKFD